MNHRLTALIPLTLFVALAAPAEGREASYEARAFDLKDGSLLYSENHEETWQGDRLIECTVSYKSPAGEVFATKTLNFTQDPAAPEFSFRDLRTGYQEGSMRRDDELVMYGGIDSPERRRVPMPEEPVIDAGFHRYIARHFDDIIAGETKDVRFAVPAYGRFFGFQVTKVGDIEYRGRPAFKLRLKASNLFLRMLSDPIDLIYDSQGRLREFEGVSNIKNDAGRPHEARIVFEYDSDSGYPVARDSQVPATSTEPKP